MTFQTELLKAFLGECRHEEPLAKHTTFRIGGPAEYLCLPETEEDTLRVLKLAHAFQLPVTLLGNGSNVLVDDAGIRGVVLRLKRHGTIQIEGNRVTVDACVLLSTLQMALLKQGLSGLEFTFGIPSTVGGALYMNLGSYGAEVKDFLVSVRGASMQGEVFERKKESLHFAYRSSDFQRRQWVILSALFEFVPRDPAQIQARMNEVVLKKASGQPLTQASAGCIFKNPPGDSAGRLIETAGGKGMQVGGIRVSEKHANYFVNLGNGCAKDVRTLIEQVQSRVRKHHGVDLALEVQVL